MFSVLRYGLCVALELFTTVNSAQRESKRTLGAQGDAEDDRDLERVGKKPCLKGSTSTDATITSGARFAPGPSSITNSS